MNPDGTDPANELDRLELDERDASDEPRCETCGERPIAPDHEHAVRHKLHRVLTDRARRGWIVVFGASAAAARRHGMVTEYEGRRQHGREAVEFLACANAESLLHVVGKRSLMIHVLRLELDAADLVRALGMPWRLALLRAGRDGTRSAATLVAVPHWWVR